MLEREARMAEKRASVTLLELASIASRAIVPVLLAVLLIVGYQRNADTTPARGSDRHVSVRHVAALKTFEYAVVRRDRVTAGPLSADALLTRVPACRSAWDGRGGLLARMQRYLSRATDSGATPASRIAIELEAIDAALLRFSSEENSRVSDKVGLDGARWAEAVAIALRTPVETPEYPNRQFSLQCADIARAVVALARSSGRMLPTLAWRGTEVDRVIARWRPEQYVEFSPRQVARINPWAGIPGCIYLAGSPDHDAPSYYVGGARGRYDRLCGRDDIRGIEAGTGVAAVRIAGEPASDMPVDDERWKLPPSLAMMLLPLEALHRPGNSLYREYTSVAAESDEASARYRYGPNRIDIGSAAVDIGFSIDTTIDPSLQVLAQQTVACYTGRDDVCRALGMTRREDSEQAIGHRMLERAMVRMAAVAIIDVASGRIEALAGAMSPCTRQEYDGPGRAARCDKRIPYPIRYRPDALLNPAVFLDAMPASTIKPIMAAAFLSDPVVGARWLSAERAEIVKSSKATPTAQSMRGQLMRSDSARFLDRMFCADKNFAPCERPWTIQQTADWFGWNRGCATPRDECGKRDLLFGRTVDAAGDDDPASPFMLKVSYGRLLTEPLAGKLGAPLRLWQPVTLDGSRVVRCAAGPDGKRFSKDDWERCSGAAVVDLVAEGWGQGHARASALGGAGMIAMLAAAANGQADVRAPHLVSAVRGAGPAATAIVKSAALRAIDHPVPNRIPRDVAEVIMSGLSFGHRAGTGRLACEQVFDAKSCASYDWIAGKTGTPTFPNDDLSLDDLAQLCANGAAKTRRDRDACGPLRPYKWYVAAYRTDRNDPTWTKAIGVLTERNWIADSGRIHAAGDHGPNPAAEIAMQIAGRHVGALPRGAH
jgi:hypothetical protein